MGNDKQTITVTINGQERIWEVGGQENLLDALRRYRYFSVKRGCDTGDCGVCTVLLEGKPVRSCMIPAFEVDGKAITTVESLDKDGEIHPIQEAFMETGAIQCGFCTPSLILTAKALLDEDPDPSEDEIRRAMRGVLCRCTGYVRVVEAVQRAAAVLRGEDPPEIAIPEIIFTDEQDLIPPGEYTRPAQDREPLPPLVFTPQGMEHLDVVGKPQEKVDAAKLAQGKAVFTDDLHLPETLYGALLTSPHAHARILDIDTTEAEELPGVHVVLTHRDLPRIKYASGGQSYPQPPPFD